MKIKQFISIFVSFIIFAQNVFAGCNGKIINPITSVCWSCLFPLSIGSIPVIPGATPDTSNYSSPVCICPRGKPPLPLPGVAIGLWEPVRLVDVSKEPFCF